MRIKKLLIQMPLKSKIIIVLSIVFAIAIVNWFLFSKQTSKQQGITTPKTEQPIKETNQMLPQSQQAPSNNQGASQTPSDFLSPLDRASERVTKKPFGIYITPQNSPIQPEHFAGYHTGADFEILPEEINAEVSVHAVCAGKLLVKKYASGYGGVVVQACVLDSQPITVIYGHLRPNSIAAIIGENLDAGAKIGELGVASSTETDGERKHLHLGFHKGTSVNILGYVSKKADLSWWIDPCLFIH